MSFLVADIGGTNARFAVWMAERPLDVQHITHYRTADYPNIVDALSAYRTALVAKGVAWPDRAILAVASAVNVEKIELANSPWHFTKHDLAAGCGFTYLHLINDFEAIARAIPTLRPDEYITIGGGTAVPNAPIGVLGPGTGLGVASLIPNGIGGWIAVPGEGGHVTATATTDFHFQVIQGIKSVHGHHHVSAERIASGKGLEKTYPVICQLLNQIPKAESAAEISANAMAGNDPAALRALEFMVDILAVSARNLALTNGCFGGIYLAGGILPKIQDWFLRSNFRNAFEAKGRREEYMRGIPTRLITTPDIAFRGLSALAAQIA
jgi:glucokinase